jgi:hypothetical protein
MLVDTWDSWPLERFLYFFIALAYEAIPKSIVPGFMVRQAHHKRVCSVRPELVEGRD